MISSSLGTGAASRSEPISSAALDRQLLSSPGATLNEVCDAVAGAIASTDQAAKLADLVDARLTALESVQTLDVLAAVTQLHRGPLHPDATVEARSGLPGFMLNDRAPYELLLSYLAKEVPAGERSAAGVRKAALTQVLWTVGTYFGNFDGSPERDARRQQRYMDASAETTFTIRDFAGTGYAMCVEKAALAQNLLAFLGYDTELFCTRMSVGADAPVGHAFNVIHTERGRFLVDFSNPIRVSLPDGGYSFTPNVHRISDDHYRELLTGGGVCVSLSHLKYDGHATSPEVTSELRYFAPNRSALTARQRVEEALNRLSTL